MRRTFYIKTIWFGNLKSEYTDRRVRSIALLCTLKEIMMIEWMLIFTIHTMSAPGVIEN